MMPQVGDEVVVGFEHDDVRRPYVLGSLWNGKDSPATTSRRPTARSRSQRRAREIAITAKDAITIKSEKDITVETDGKIAPSTGRAATITVEGAAA